MKRISLLLIAGLLLGLLCGCAPKPPAPAEAAVKSLAVEQGYERRAVKLELSAFDGEIAAAALHDEKLWFASDQVLYNANLDGSDVREVFGELPENTQYIAFSADGDIYVGTSVNVYVFTPDGVQKSQFQLDNTPEKFYRMFDLAAAPEGGMAALVWDYRGGAMLLAVTGESFGDALDLPVDAGVRSICFHDGDMLLALDDGLFVYSETELFPILEWTDIGAVAMYAYVAGVTENGDIIYLDRYDGSLYIIQTVPRVSGITELTLAVVNELGISAELAKAAATFNASSGEYKIKIVQYTSLDLLNVQIIAGNIPDLIEVWDNVPFGAFAAKGLFEDLNPYFDSDPEVALLPSVRRVLSTDDKLFRVTPGFMLMSLIGLSDFVGRENGWTFEEMKQYLAKAPEGSTVFPPYWNKESILLFSLYQRLDEFVDWESGRALFDTQEFKDMLEFVNTVPDDPPIYNLDTLLPDGRQLIFHGGCTSVEDYVYQDNFYGGKMVYKGFPSSKRYSGVLFPGSYILAITSACTDKTAAWNFIRTALLTDENFQAMPTVQSRFDAAIEKAMTEPGYRNEFDGGKMIQVQNDPMTQAQREKLLDIIDKMGVVVDGDIALQTMIAEEIPAYFAGQKSLDEVCRIIQNRAQTYVSEQL